MNLTYGLVSDYLYWIADFAYAVLLGLAVYTAPWRSFIENRQRSHVFLGGSVFLLVIWQMSAGLDPGLSYHLLGATLFVLMFGWQLAFIGVSLVLLGTTLNGGADLSSLALNGLIMVAIPVFVSYGILRFAVRFLPHHFFVYVIGNGFLCGGLAMLSTLAVASVVLAMFSGYSFDMLRQDYLPFAPLMTFAEAFFTGMLTASMVLFRPDWMSTFDDRRYLVGK